MITLDLSKAKLAEDLGSYKEKVAEIHDMIRNKTGAGNDFLGWVELPENYDKEEVQLMKETAAKLREKVDVLLVCGIGGSYLGARAAIEAINGLYSDDKVEIIYVGNTFWAFNSLSLDVLESPYACDTRTSNRIDATNPSFLLYF